MITARPWIKITGERLVVACLLMSKIMKPADAGIIFLCLRMMQMICGIFGERI